MNELRFKAILLGSACLMLLAGSIAAGQMKGAERLILYGGSTGDVPFPHQTHQTVIGDCQVCHDIFPQAAGAIEQLKAEKKLKRKQVMNKHCIDCHRAMKKEGAVTGPTTCKACHVKQK